MLLKGIRSCKDTEGMRSVHLAEEYSVGDVTRYTCLCSCRQVFECQNIKVNIAEGMHLYKDKATVCR